MIRIRPKLKISIIVFALALGVRLFGLGEIMTADEGIWMIRSKQFYEALLQGNPGGTYLTTHPGATPMWLVGLGEVLAEWRLGAGVDEGTLSLFLMDARWPLVLMNSSLIGLIAWLLGRWLSSLSAGVAGVLLATEPYLVGMSQIAHLDGLQALLMLASLLLFFRGWTAAAGVAWGLALGGKFLLALWLAPVFCLMLLVGGERPGASRWGYMIRKFGLAVGVASLTLWLVWPALWVKDDLGRSLSRDYASVVADEHIDFGGVPEPTAPATFYLRTLLGRLTPQVQILLVASSWYLVARSVRRNYKLQTTNYKLLTCLLLYALGYLAVITLAAKKADRYALPALAVAPLVAGIVAAWAGQIVARRWHWSKRMRTIVGGVLFLAVVALPLLWSPYAIAYNNPLWPNIRPLTQQGWGEGLEEAAAWLNERPRSDQMYIASWYPSVMGNFFHGKTLSLSSRQDARVQYLVVYRNMGGRGPEDQATVVLGEADAKKPVHTVFIQGVPYVWIYETKAAGTFERHVGELFGSKSVGQVVMPDGPVWWWIDIGFATFSSRHNTEDVYVHIRAALDAEQDLRTVVVKASTILDNEWQRFEFEPLPVAGGQEYFVVVNSPASTPGNAVTVRYTEADIRPGNLYVNDTAKNGDMAYRVRE